MLQSPLQSLTWAPVRAAPTLGDADLHLWKIPAGCDGAPVGDLWALLSAAERERAARLRLTVHRERYLRAQGGLRRILASYLNLSPDLIVFLRGEHGKPDLAGTHPPIRFNLTTSGDLALVGVSLRLPLGVDCERLRRCGELAGIARRMFAPEVAEQVMAVAEGERPERFFRAWTALEAAVKADGRGLFHRDARAPVSGLRIEHCIPQAGYVAAVARLDLPPVTRWQNLIMDAGGDPDPTVTGIPSRSPTGHAGVPMACARATSDRESDSVAAKAGDAQEDNMTKFDNILFVDDPARDGGAALERAVAVAEEGQAKLTLVRVLEPLPTRPGLPLADLTAAAERVHLAQLEALAAPHRGRVALRTCVLRGIPFLEVIRQVLRGGHDLVMKPAGEGGGLHDRLFGSLDLHLLRKCPCPVWLLRPIATPSYQCVLAAVDFDPYGGRPEEQELNLRILELAVWLAVSEVTDLHVVHAWETIAEDMLRVWGSGEAAAAYVEEERRHHAESLSRLLEETRRRVGRDAFGYAAPIPQLLRGPARRLVPELAQQHGADLVVMGTVGRSGVPGLIIGNTAEAILGQVTCSVLAIKPPRFVSPVTLEDPDPG